MKKIYKEFNLGKIILFNNDTIGNPRISQILIPATDEIRELSESWQHSLKMQKEKLRKEILYGVDGRNEDCNIKYTEIENTTKLQNITEVGIGMVDIDTQEYIISKFNLENDQRRAFIIITDHLENKSFLKIGN